MHIRDAQTADLPALTNLTIDAFRPLFEQHLPQEIGRAVFAHDHAQWRDDYRQQVPELLDPENGQFVTLAEDGDTVLGFVGWNITEGDSGRLELVAVHPTARRHGVAAAVCRAALASMKTRGVTVVHVGTGGDAFHAPARALYESLGFSAYPVVDYTRSL